jgi:beta-RFAP synthase
MSRRFGGVGLMIQAPGIDLHVEPAQAWSVEGPLSERARLIVRRLLGQDDWPPLRIQIHHAAREHQGLGTGTQLALALARALAEQYGWENRTALELACRVGRGKRSALGIYGFAHGGLLVDGGKHNPEGIAPLVAQMPFPEDWRVVLILPPWEPGLHGQQELDAFSQLESHATNHTDALCRLILLGLLPTLAEKDFLGFSQSLQEFNQRSGEVFVPIQGGPYANSHVAELISSLRNLGVPGVGQSSWGPAIFALAADEAQAAWLAQQIPARHPIPPEAVFITSADNKGAQIWRSEPPIEKRKSKIANS